VLARLGIVAVSIVLVVLLVGERADSRACTDAREELFGVALGERPAAGEPAALKAIADRCRGSEGLAAASGALRRQGRDREALALAARAARAEPESAQAWAAIASAARRINPGLSVRAGSRARELGARGS